MMCKLAHGLRKLFFCFSVLLILLIPEISARLLSKVSKPQSPFPNYPYYVEISHGYKHVDQLIQDWSAVWVQYHDYYIYSPGPASSKTVNFTDYFGARATPASADLDEADEVIWAFGGSTMADLETDDDLSLANQIAVELNKDNVKARVRNFGVGGFQSSLETIKFQDLLRRVPLRERPTTVIFYDGFNDVGYGYNFGAASLPRDVSLKLRDLVDRNYTRLLVYIFSELLSRHSVFWKDFIRNRINKRLYEGQTTNQDSENLDKTVSSYVVNVRMTRGICQELHIRCLFILQPLIITKANPTSVERKVLDSFGKDFVHFARGFYMKSTLQLHNQEGFLDLSHILDQSEESDFYDLGHTSPFAGTTIGREIATQIVKSRRASGLEAQTARTP